MDDFKNAFSLNGKTALVIGAGGLGLPIARALMQNGADIILADMKEPDGAFAASCHAEGRQCTFVQVNLLDEESIVKMVAAARNVTGRIDILVNAAGVNKLIKAEDYDSKAWDFVLGINLRGLYLVTREVGKVMIEQNYGRILSISSVKSFIGTDADYTAYCASKGAVNMYTKQLACEWGKYGITANAIAPTFTRTPINSFQLDDPVFYKTLVDRIPRGRICTAHGNIIDEDALYEALKARKIAGAALDVFSVEPLPVPSRLTKLDNLILTPHVASQNLCQRQLRARNIRFEGLEVE